MDLDQLLSIVPPEAPAGFAAFWEHRHRVALTTAPQPYIRDARWMLKEHAVYDLRYLSTDGVEIGGWLLLPKDGNVSRGIVIGHGYGGREAPDEPPEVDAAALLFPCFRGLGRSPVAKVSPNPRDHVLHDIQDRERYILGGCVDDLWLAVSALLDLFPSLSGRIGYSGASFGGGIGAMAVPWDKRIQRLHLQVPTFGHQALRLTLPCIGSGESVRAFQRHHDFNILETLAYYDSATAMRYLRIPALIAVARFDPVVPPPGQFAVYNAVPENLRCLFVLDAGHFDYPRQTQQTQEMNRELACFFMAL